MKLLATLLIAACASGAQAQIVSRDSLHLKPKGTVVRDYFVLVNRVVPLPEGEFTFFASEDRVAGQGHKLVTVVLGQMADGKLRAAVGASAVVAYAGSRGWTVEPCKDDKVVLYRLERAPFMKRNYETNCLVVNRLASSLGPESVGLGAGLGRWVKERGGETPVPMLVDATITRVAVAEYLLVRYIFNPAAFGCGPANLNSPDFANGVIEVGKAMQVGVGEGFGGRVAPVTNFVATAPRLLQDCGKTVQAAAPKPRARAGSTAERLKELDSLREQGLITPAEYDERRRKILDSL